VDVTREGIRPLAATLALALALGPIACADGADHVVVGAKNFSEQTLLGEIVSEWIESTTDVAVERRFQLGGTFIAHRAVTSGDIDLYVEYTGTALTTILEREPMSDPSAVLGAVRKEYDRRWGLEVLDPLGFENTFAMLVRSATADSFDLHTLSDLSSHAAVLRPGFGYEFMEREDGFRGLKKAYGLEFAGPPREMDLGLIYRALAIGEIDLTAGNSTEGKIESLDLRMLADDRGYFPPYEAVIVVRPDALERHPRLRGALDDLSGRIDTRTMRALNRKIDVDGRDFAVVAKEWVESTIGGAAKQSGSR